MLTSHDPQRFDVTGLRSIAHLLPPANGRCGVYLLTFVNGEHHVGQADDVVARFADHRGSYPDITGLAFWQVPRADRDELERAEIHRLTGAGLPLRRVTQPVDRPGAGDLDLLVSPADQQRWLTDGLPAWAGRDIRPDRPGHRLRGRSRYEELTRDSRFPDLVYAVRDYVNAAVPFPRRTEMVQWSISARPETNARHPRLLAVTIHGVETMFAGEPGLRSIVVRVDGPALLRHFGSLDTLMEHFGAVFAQQTHDRTHPDIVSLTVSDPGDLIQLLHDEGVVAAARALSLSLMRKGPSLWWEEHNFDLADRLFERADPAFAPLPSDTRLHRQLAV